MKQFFTKPSRVTVEQYDSCKYFGGAEEGRRTEYRDVEAFEVVHGEAAALMEAGMDPASVDDFHEYLVIYMASGETATYRNSYVDMFKI